jgi:hypothetical protein
MAEANRGGEASLVMPRLGRGINRQGAGSLPGWCPPIKSGGDGKAAISLEDAGGEPRRAFLRLIRRLMAVPIWISSRLNSVEKIDGSGSPSGATLPDLHTSPFRQSIWIRSNSRAKRSRMPVKERPSSQEE